ncbi:MG2 domain-containing protein [Yoonia sp. R2331]|uniref:alpha-2-macroglobulin family protein n=1 Tax=Yoonia sp. R2331 TaxID=3237238 RepID=UPI0034E5D3A5
MIRILAACFFAIFATQLLADLPDRRPIVSRDVDFFGADLQSIFDTTLNACQAACVNDNQCRAFTFNQRSSSCFLKGTVTEVVPYEGAVSARIYDTDPAVLAVEDARRADLSFLSANDLSEADRLSSLIGRRHAANEVSLGQLLERAARQRDSGNLLQALRLTGAATSISDASDLWITYAVLARTVQTDDPTRAQAARERALPAAISGYMRALNDPARATALMEIAQILVQRNRGRDAIAALRLAQAVQARDDAQVMLDDLVGKFGFRVVDTQVESDSASPRICAVFNEALVNAGVDYAPFVQLPDPALAVTVKDRQLCIAGMTHGERIRFVLRAGLPAASGEVLTSNTELTQYIRDRSAGVKFTSRAYVLPRAGEVAIPLETVNLTEVDLTLRRLSDRNILRTMQEGLLSNPLYAYEQEYLDADLASTVWTGVAEVEQDLNRDVLTRVPMDEALTGQPAGLYVLSATVPGADPYDNPPATQWFVLSDIGIASYLGNDGLTVVARGLGDAAPMNGATVELISEGNAVLASAMTDAEGIATFAAGLTRGFGADAPALVTVTKGDDLAFLSLRDAAFDLSDRGVAGREPSPPIDVFLTPDRGAYRAGETIHLTALMRDARAQAVAGVPLTAVLTRPDGVEYARVTSASDLAGGHVFALPVAGTAPRGTWRVAVHVDPDAPSLASRNVLVEDFLPERIDFELELPEQIKLGTVPQATLDARYLFGPPAADLAIEGEATLRVAATLEGFAGYVFGDANAPFDPETRFLDGGTTDAQGQASLAVTLPDVTATQPLELTVQARVSEGSGRPVERSATAVVLPDAPFIGIKPRFDGVVREGTEASFDLIALSSDLTPAAIDVAWTLNRVTTRYQWYSLYGDWNWEPVTERTRVASGSAALGADPVTVAGDVKWGRYELIVERTGADYAVASTDFYAGWYAPASATDTPDVLEASLDAESYAIGDTATFRIVPRYAGTAVVSVMSDHLISLKTVAVTEGENLITLPVTDEWGAGAYVSASVIRPMDVAAGRNPARSLGLGYAAVAPGDKALGVSLDAPEVMRPRGALNVGITLDGMQAGQTAYVTLAAVDLGILNITGFDSPDPQGHYFGQRKLGVELRDLYGRLIDGLNGTLGRVRSGGDAMAQVGMQSPPPTEDLVVFFQGPVMIGADGKALIPLDIPAFNGTLRLMAVAWTDTSVGQAEHDVIVRDPVVVTASVPRFLAPDDQSRLLLEVVHSDGPAGEVGLSVQSNGLALAQVLPASVTLAEGERRVFEVPFAAVDPGTHQITLSVTPPDGARLEQVLTVPVVVNDPVVSRISRFALAPDATFLFDDNVFAGLRAGTGRATLSVGPLARFDAPGLLAALDRYPYGCTEQITSRAMPLLYFASVAKAMGLAQADQVDQRIAEAIAAIGANQAANGGFGLWRASSGDLWLDAYVTDFLSRARARGQDVPPLMFRNAVDNLRNGVNYYPDFDAGGADLAYALMVLAREGAAAVGDLRYFADQKAGDFATPMAQAQLGAALALYGDQTRADALFARAAATLAGRPQEDMLWRSDYGTYRRDAAAVLALAVEAGSTAVNRDDLLIGLGQEPGQASTQEAAWTLLAANALIDDLRSAGITVNGAVPKGPVVQVLDAQVAGAASLIANTGTAPTDITVTTFGVPAEPEPAGGNGYAIERAYYTTDGAAVDPAEVTVGERLVTVLTVTPFGRQEARLMVNDPLPAGFEIDNPNLLKGGDIRALVWLDPVRGETAEFRTDRFLAAVDWRSENAFQLAYIVRAVSPGAFHHPAASVEDMYRPQMRARTAAGRVTIAQ